MGNSLQDQLRKAGLVSTQKLRQNQTAKRKTIKAKGKPPSEEARRAQQAAAAKAERDRALNREREEAAQRKAEEQALRQWIHEHRLPRGGGEIAFHFQDGERLKRIYVTAEQQRALVRGRLGLVRQDANYELLPRELTEKVWARKAELVLVLNEPEPRGGASAAEDDPYADYQVPDDLLW